MAFVSTAGTGSQHLKTNIDVHPDKHIQTITKVMLNLSQCSQFRILIAIGMKPVFEAV